MSGNFEAKFDFFTRPLVTTYQYTNKTRRGILSPSKIRGEEDELNENHLLKESSEFNFYRKSDICGYFPTSL